MHFFHIWADGQANPLYYYYFKSDLLSRARFPLRGVIWNAQHFRQPHTSNCQNVKYNLQSKYTKLDWLQEITKHKAQNCDLIFISWSKRMDDCVTNSAAACMTFKKPLSKLVIAANSLEIRC